MYSKSLVYSKSFSKHIQHTRCQRNETQQIKAEQTDLLVEGNLLKVWQSPLSQVGLAGSDGSGAAQGQVVEKAVTKCTPSVELTLQALNIGQEVDDVQVGVVLPGGNSGLDLVVLGTEESNVVWPIAVAGTQVTCKSTGRSCLSHGDTR